MNCTTGLISEGDAEIRKLDSQRLTTAFRTPFESRKNQVFETMAIRIGKNLEWILIPNVCTP